MLVLNTAQLLATTSTRYVLHTWHTFIGSKLSCQQVKSSKMTTHKLTLYSEKLAQYLERVRKGSDEREAMRQVIKKEKNERPEMVYLTFLCYACVQERTWLTLSYPPLKPSLSLSISSSQQQSLSFSHILLN